MSFIDPKDSLEEIKRAVLSALNRAGHDRKSALRYITLSTNGLDGPNARYVVLRNFDLADHKLLIYTDYRSDKITEMQEEPKVSVLAYDSQKKLQLKMRGIASIHYQDKFTQEHWSNLSSGKEAYQTAKAPGSKVTSLAAGQARLQQDDATHFCVIAINVLELEVLQLHQEGHIRAHFDLVDSQSSFLVP